MVNKRQILILFFLIIISSVVNSAIQHYFIAPDTYSYVQVSDTEYNIIWQDTPTELTHKELYYDTDNAGTNGIRIATMFYDTFSGVAINSSEWTEQDQAANYITQNDEIIFSGGTGSWGDVALVSQDKYPRGDTWVFECKVNCNSDYYMMLGIKNSNSNYSYTEFIYAIYLNRLNIYIYEDGANRGDSGQDIALNTWYTFRIVVKADVGALYYYRQGSSGPYTLLYNSVYSSESNMKVGFTTRERVFRVDDVVVDTGYVAFANDQRDSWVWDISGLGDFSYYIYSLSATTSEYAVNYSFGPIQRDSVGPVGGAATSTLNPVNSSGTFTVTVPFDDTNDSGVIRLMSAEYFVDTFGYTGNGVSCTVADGTFDEQIEDIIFDTSAYFWGEGETHQFVVYCKDDLDNISDSVTITITANTRSDTVLLNTPSDSAIVSDTYGYLVWDIPADAGGDTLDFIIYLSTDLGFGEESIIDTGISAETVAQFEYYYSGSGWGIYPETGVISGQSQVRFLFTNLIHNTTYYWRVTAYDNQYYSDTSLIYSFCVDTGYTDVSPPETVTLQNPADNSETTDNTPILNWTASSDTGSGLAGYNVQISSMETFPFIIQEDTVATNSYTPNVLVDSIYYWRVRAYDNSYNFSDWSDTYKFTVDTLDPVLNYFTTTDNDTKYANEQEITVIMYFNDDIDSFTINFASIDSSYDTDNRAIIENGNGTYTVTYTISSTNNKSNANDYYVQVFYSDTAGNTVEDTTYKLELYNNDMQITITSPSSNADSIGLSDTEFTIQWTDVYSYGDGDLEFYVDDDKTDSDGELIKTIVGKDFDGNSIDGDYWDELDNDDDITQSDQINVSGANSDWYDPVALVTKNQFKRDNLTFYCKFQSTARDEYVMLGLKNNSGSYDYEQFVYATYLVGNGRIYIYEDGVSRGYTNFDWDYNYTYEFKWELKKSGGCRYYYRKLGDPWTLYYDSYYSSESNLEWGFTNYNQPFIIDDFRVYRTDNFNEDSDTDSVTINMSEYDEGTYYIMGQMYNNTDSVGLYSVYPITIDRTGPVSELSRVSNNPVDSDGTTTIYFSLRDNDDAGDINVDTGEYFITTVGSDGSGTTVNITDGTVDSDSEMFQFTIDLSNLSEGTTRTIYFHGADAIGNWGSTDSTIVTANTRADTVDLSSPSDKSTTSDTAPYLVWDIPSDASNDLLHFIIQVSSTVDFTNIIDSGYSYQSTDSFSYYTDAVWKAFFDTGVPSGISSVRFGLSVGLDNNATYYWRVNSYDNQYFGDTSSVYTLYVDTSYNDTTAPDTVNTALPQDYHETSTTSPVFIWETVVDSGSGLQYYDIQISTDMTYTSVFINDSSAAAYYNSSGLFETTFFWRVRAVDNKDNTGAWSYNKTLIIDTTPPVINYIITIDNDTNYQNSNYINLIVCFNSDVDTIDASFSELDSNWSYDNLSISKITGETFSVSYLISDNNTKTDADTYRIAITGYDTADNIVSDTTFLIELDNDSPSLRIILPSSSNAVKSNSDTTFTFSWADNYPSDDAIMEWYYDTNNSGYDGYPIYNMFKDDFVGSVINSDKWTEYDNDDDLTQNGKLICPGFVGNWGDLAIVTKNKFIRDDIVVECTFKHTGNNYVMWGIKDSTTGYDYRNFIYAIYIRPSGNTLGIYEDGSRRLWTSYTMTTGITYKLRIRVKADGGATYYYKQLGGNWIELYDSEYSTESNLKPGLTINDGSFEIDDYRIYRKNMVSEDDSTDTAIWVTDGLCNGEYYIYGIIQGGSDTVATYSEGYIIIDTVGPIISNFTSQVSYLTHIGTTTITADIDDSTDSGFATIDTGEYFIDSVGNYGSGTVAATVDDSFDSETESVQFTLNGTSWAEGTAHYIYLRCRDSLANYNDTIYITVYANERPETPTLSTPNNNANVAETDPYLIWNIPNDSSNDTLHFIIQISTDNSFTEVYDSGITTISTTGFEYYSSSWNSFPASGVASGAGKVRFQPSNPGLTNAQTHYWRVIAYDNQYYSDTSAVCSFYLDTAFNDTTPPDTVDIISPSTASSTSAVHPLFVWNEAQDSGTGINYYQILISTIDDFSDTTLYDSTSDVSYTPLVALYQNIYYWRIRSIDFAGNVCGWTEAYTLNIDTTSPVINFVLTTDNDTIYANNDKVTIILNCDLDADTVLANFNQVDSKFDTDNVIVTDDSNGTFTIEYTIQNTNSSSDDTYAVYIYVYDTVLNSTLYTLWKVELNNSVPSINILTPNGSVTDWVGNTDTDYIIVWEDNYNIGDAHITWYYSTNSSGTPYYHITNKWGDDFDGSSIDDGVWLENDPGGYISQSDKIISSGGDGSWGNCSLTTKSEYSRTALSVIWQYTPKSNGYMMMGVKNTNTNYSYTEFIYAIYSRNNDLYIYEDGSNRGDMGYNTTNNVTYEMRIDIDPVNGADYYYRQIDGQWQLLYSSEHSYESPLVFGFTNYNRSFTVDNYRVHYRSITSEDDSTDTALWDVNGLPDDVYYIKGEIQAGSDSSIVVTTDTVTIDRIGPEITSVTADINPVNSSGTANVTIITTDVPDSGSVTIDTMEYFIDSTSTNGSGTTVGSVSGTYDTQVETGKLTLSTLSWSEGETHTYYFHSKDYVSNWGDYGSITITANTRSSTPTLTSPSDGSTTDDTYPYLIWSVPSDDSGDTLHFVIQISSTNNFSDIQDSGYSYNDTTGFEYYSSSWGAFPANGVAQGVSNVRYKLQTQLFNNTTYYWKVTAYDNQYYSDTSFVYTILIDTGAADTTPPGTVSISYPDDYTETQDVTPLFLWSEVSDTGTGVDYYQILISTTSSFADTVIFDSTSITEYTSTSLTENNYYWRVRAIDRSSNIGGWSDSRVLTIDTTPPIINYFVTTDNDTTYQNATFIEVIVCFNNDIDTFTVDFNNIDNSYDTSRLSITENGSGTYTISYKISASNNNANADTYYMSITGYDTSMNSVLSTEWLLALSNDTPTISITQPDALGDSIGLSDTEYYIQWEDFAASYDGNLDFYYDDDQADYNGTKIANKFRDLFTGTIIDEAKWSEVDADNYISQNDKLIVSDGNNNWTDCAMATDEQFDRAYAYTTEMLVEPTNNPYFFFGWKDSSGSFNYTNFVYAMYRFPGNLRIYEDGTNRGNQGITLDNDIKYYLKITLKPDGGAYYYYKQETWDTYTLIYNSTYSTEDNLRPGFTNNRAGRGFDCYGWWVDFSNAESEDDSADSTLWDLTGVNDGVYYIYGSISNSTRLYEDYASGTFTIDRHGPEISSINILNNPVTYTGTTTVNVIADDSNDSGDISITAVEYFQDSTGSNGTGTSISAIDGTYDYSEETGSFILNTLSWPEGESHILYFHSADAIGNWGSFDSVTVISNTRPDTISPSSPSNNGTVDDTQPYLVWTVPADDSNDTLHFNIIISSYPGFEQYSDSGHSNENITNFEYYSDGGWETFPGSGVASGAGNVRFKTNVELDNFTTYYWIVTAYDGQYNSDTNSVLSFYVDTGFNDTTGPTQVNLLIPDNNADTNETDLVFQWSESTDTGTGIDYYEIQISSYTGMQYPDISDSTPDIKYSSSGLVDTYYFWKVRAVDNNSNTGPWSDTGQFHCDITSPACLYNTTSDADTTYYNLQTITVISVWDSDIDTISATFYNVDSNYDTSKLSVTAQAGGTFTITYTLSALNSNSSGTYNVSVTGYDTATNSKTDTTWIIYFQTDTPVIEVTQPDGTNDYLVYGDTEVVIKWDDAYLLDDAWIEWFYDTDNTGQDGWRLGEHFSDRFDNSDTVADTKWIDIDNGGYFGYGDSLSVYGGASSWGAVCLVSEKNFKRSANVTFFGRLTRLNSWYVMFGIKDNSTSYSFTNFIYAIYLAGNTIRIYEDGGYRSTIAGVSTALGNTYDFRIDVNSGNGATYYYRQSGSDTWTILYTSVYSSEDDFKVGFTNHSGIFEATDFMVYKNSMVSEDDSTDTGLWDISDVPDNQYYVYAVITNGIDSTVDYSPGVYTIDRAAPYIDYITSSSNQVFFYNDVAVTAAIVDSGNLTIDTGEYFTNVVASNGSGTDCTAFDGSFNGSSETTVITISANSLNANETNVIYVHARDLAGNWGTEYGTVAIYVYTIPDTPELVTPPDDQYASETQPLLYWNIPDNQTNLRLHFIIQISSDVSFSDIVDSGNTSETTANFEYFSSAWGSFLDTGVDPGDGQVRWQPGNALTNDVTYYWRVTAFDSEYYSDTTAYFNFAVDISFNDTFPPDTVTLLIPADDASTSITQPKFQWNAVTDTGVGIVNYNICISTDITFGDVTFEDTVSPTNYNGSTLWDSTFYWKVRAIDIANNVGGFSSIYTLVVDTGPPIKYYHNTTDDDTMYSNANFINITTCWSSDISSLNADFSLLDSGFDTDNMTITDQSGGTYTIKYLVSGDNTNGDADYRISIIAYDVSGNFETDTTWTVTLNNAIPSITFIEPDGDSDFISGSDTSFTFRWADAYTSDDASLYWFYDDDNTDSDGQLTGNYFYENFNGSTLNTSKWDKMDQGTISQDESIIVTGGENDWGSTWFSSLSTFDRSDTKVLIFKFIPTGSSNRVMLGFKDNTDAYDYRNFVYAIYQVNNNIRIYEDGNNRGDQGTYFAANDTSYIKIVLKPSGGANYYHSVNRTDWSTVYTSTYSTESNLKFGFTNNRGSFIIDDVYIYNWNFYSEDDSQDTGYWDVTDLSDGTYYLYGVINGAGDTFTKYTDSYITIDRIGAEISRVSVSDNPITYSGTTQITVVADDTNDSGNLTISSMEYFIDVIGDTGSGTYVSPSDGGYSSPIETNTLTIDATGWSEGTQKTYYFHAKDNGGNWGTYDSITITANTRPDTVSIVSPSDSATVLDTYPTLTWSVPDDASGDTLQFFVYISTSQSFTTIYDSGLTTCSITGFQYYTSLWDTFPTAGVAPGASQIRYEVQTELTDTTTFYWYVVAYDSQYQSDTQSTIYSFYVNTQIADTTPPDTPVITAPSDNHDTKVQTPVILWSTVTDTGSGVSYYEIYLSSNYAFSAIDRIESSGINKYTFSTISAETLYYYKVRAVDVSGNVGGWSDSRSFTIDITSPVFYYYTTTDEDTIYQNTARIEIISYWDTQIDTVTANFSNLDSDFDTSNVTISADTGGTYTITYTISAGNTKEDDDTYYVIIYGYDTATNYYRDTSYLIEINNSLPSITVSKPNGAIAGSTSTLTNLEWSDFYPAGNGCLEFYTDTDNTGKDGERLSNIYMDRFNSESISDSWTITDDDGYISLNNNAIVVTNGASDWGQTAFVNNYGLTRSDGDYIIESSIVLTNNGRMMWGIKDNSLGLSYTNFIYAIYINRDDLYIYEDGSNRGIYVTNQISQSEKYWFRIKVGSTQGADYYYRHDDDDTWTEIYSSAYSTESDFGFGFTNFDRSFVMDDFMMYHELFGQENDSTDSVYFNNKHLNDGVYYIYGIIRTDNDSNVSYSPGIVTVDRVGPEQSGLNIYPAISHSGGTVDITMTINDDNDSGAMKIFKSEYFIDSIGSDNAGTTILCGDGTYDETSETVSLTLNTYSWSEGQEKILYIHSQDQAGNWCDYDSVVITANKRPDTVTLISLENNATTDDTQPTLSWYVPADTSHADSLHFVIQISTDINFNNITDSGYTYQSTDSFSYYTSTWIDFPDTGVPANQSTVRYQIKRWIPVDTYFWRVTAYDGQYFSDTSPVYLFVVDTDYSDTTGPDTVILNTPSDNYETNTLTPYLTWNASSDSGTGLSYYDVYISTDNTFTDVYVQDSTTAVYYTSSSLMADTTWYWKVRGVDNSSNNGGWSAYRTMIIDTTPPQLFYQSSTDADTIYQNSSNITIISVWDSGVDTVTVDFSQIDSNFDTDNVTVTDNTGGTFTITYLITSTNTKSNDTYNIRVIATDNAGNKNYDTTWKMALFNGIASITVTNPDGTNDYINTDSQYYIVEWSDNWADSDAIIEFYYDDDNSGFDGYKLNNVIWDQFAGSTIDENKWTEMDNDDNYIRQNDKLIISDGAGSWGEIAFVSDTTIRRNEQAIEIKYTPQDSNNRVMWGFKNTSTNYNYNQWYYAIYCNSNEWFYIYEGGSNRGNKAQFIVSKDYWLRIELKETSGARYYYRDTKYGNWKLLYDSNYSSATEFQMGFTVYSGAFEFDDFYLINKSMYSENDSNDKDQWLTDDINDGTYYIYSIIDGGGDTQTDYSDGYITIDRIGPIVSETDVSPNPSNSFGTVTITATISDSNDSGSIFVAAVEYFINSIGDTGTGTSVSAGDGTFDEESETVEFTLNTSDWNEGQIKTVYIHGQDKISNWGVYQGISVTANERPDTVSLVSPPNSGNTDDTRPYFVWSIPDDSGGDTLYFHIQISTSSDFSNINDADSGYTYLSITNFDYFNGSDWVTIPTGGVTQGSNKVRFRPDTYLADAQTYYWRVTAYDSQYFADTSTEWTVYINSGYSDTYAPDKVTLINPDDRTETKSLSIKLNWNEASDTGTGINYYNVIISTSTVFDSEVQSGTISVTYYDVSGLWQGTYYWRVRAVDNASNTGQWSDYKTLIVDTTPPAVVTVATTDNDTIYPNSDKITIIVNSPDADTVLINFSNVDSNFDTTNQTVSVTAGGTFTVEYVISAGNINSDDTYTVYINVYDTAENVTLYSSWSVYLNNADPGINIYYPGSDVYIGMGETTATFKWTDSWSSSNADLQFYYQDNNSDQNGTPVKDMFADRFTGATINTVLWTEQDGSNYISQDEEIIVSDGTDAWGDCALVSNETFSRKDFYVQCDFEYSQNRYMVWGVKDGTISYHRNNFIYGIYLNNGNVYIYEDGTNRGDSGENLSIGTTYEFRIYVKESGGATYYYRTKGTLSWTELYDSTYSTESDLKVGFSNYSMAFTIDNFYVSESEIMKENDNRDTGLWINDDVVDGSYYIYGVINTGSDTAISYSNGRYIIDRVGPEILNIAPDYNPVRSNGTTAIYINAYDGNDTGGVIVTGIEYFTDSIGDTGSGTSISADDGSYNTQDETGSFILDVTSWSEGQSKTLYFHAQDYAGNWGAFSSITITANSKSDSVNLTSLSDGGITTETQPVLVWDIPEDSSNDTLHFKIIISTSSDLTNITDTGMTSDSITGFEYYDGASWGSFPSDGVKPGEYQVRYRVQYELPNDVTYYWTVIAYDNQYYSDTKAIYSFSVDTGYNDNIPPDTVAVNYPNNNIDTNNVDLKIQWDAASDTGTGVNFYLCILTHSNDYSDTITTGTSTSTSYTFENLYDSPYYFGVRAVDNNSNFGGWSTVRFLNVDTDPPELNDINAVSTTDDDTIYQDGSTIKIKTYWTSDIDTVTADFSNVDSNFDVDNVIVTATAGDTFDIRYVISENNSTADGTYTITITGYDSATNSYSYSNWSVALDNSVPSISVIEPDGTEDIVLASSGDTYYTFSWTDAWSSGNAFINWYYDTDSSGEDGWKLPNLNYDTFGGSIVNSADYFVFDDAGYITQNNKLMFSGGSSSWGDVGIIHDLNFNRRAVAFQVEVTPTGGGTVLFGWKDNDMGLGTGDFIYGLYLTGININVYEGGTNRGTMSTALTNSETYIFMIVLKSSAGAEYYYKQYESDTFILLYDSSYSSKSPLKFAISNYSRPMVFDDLYYYNSNLLFENESNDSGIFYITGLDEDNYYIYSIIADGNDSNVAYSPGYVTVDLNPPVAPTNFSVTAIVSGGETGVLLTWTPSTSADSKGYNIYRSQTYEGAYSLVYSEYDTSSVIDTTVTQGQNYFYYIKTEDYAGNESDTSEILSAANITIQKEVSQIILNGTPSNPIPGAGIIYKITVTNNGYGRANNIQVYSAIPSNSKYRVSTASDTGMSSVQGDRGSWGSPDWTNDGDIANQTAANSVIRLRWQYSGSFDAGSSIIITYEVVID